jgi:hypothetical protein
LRFWQVAYLTQKLQEAEMMLQAKESRLQDVLKQKKKAIKKAAAKAFEDGIGAAGGGGGIFYCVQCFTLMGVRNTYPICM